MTAPTYLMRKRERAQTVGARGAFTEFIDRTIKAILRRQIDDGDMFWPLKLALKAQSWRPCTKPPKTSKDLERHGLVTKRNMAKYD